MPYFSIYSIKGGVYYYVCSRMIVYYTNISNPVYNRQFFRTILGS